MGFLKSLFGLFSRPGPDEAPTVQRPLPPAPDDDEEEDRTVVMTRKQVREVTEPVTQRTGKK